jgi:hypothetical protein
VTQTGTFAHRRRGTDARDSDGSSQKASPGNHRSPSGSPPSDRSRAALVRDRQPAARIARRARHDMTDSNDRAESSEPTAPNDPTDSTEAKEPTEPIDNVDPMEPIESTDPREAMHSVESVDAIDHRDDFPLAVTWFSSLGYTHGDRRRSSLRG